MKVFSAPLSLFSRKVEIALLEKGLAFERVMVPFSQTEGYSLKHPEVLSANPKRRCRVLVDGDLTLFDSTLILEHLEDAYPLPSLFPDTPAERERCRLRDLFRRRDHASSPVGRMHRTTSGPLSRTAG